MLHQRIRNKSKGPLLPNKFGKGLASSVPMISIFALLGIITYATTIITFDYADEEKAYAVASDIPTASSSLIIDNGDMNSSTSTSRNSVAYSSHTIQVKANNIDSYALTITGPTNLSNDGTTIGSIGTDVLGSNIGDNKWGYGWGDKDTTNANLRYNGFTGDVQKLDDNTTTAISSNKIDFEKKLVFAVKFNDSAATGHYQAKVALNLTLTPHLVATLADLTYLQDMTPDICANTPKPTTTATEYTLKDIRDSNSYKVAKLTDGNCWMTENMKLDLSTTTLNAANSDVSAIYAAGTATKVTTASSWSSTNTIAQWTPQVAVNSSSKGDGNGYQTEYGYYYSWCAATAGTCSSVTTDNTDASGSICPKGWKLPKGSTMVSDNDFAQLMNKEGANITSLSSSTNISWSSKLYAGPPASFTLGGADWYRAGYVDPSGLGAAGIFAFYWSRTAYAGDYIYRIDMTSNGDLFPANSSPRYYGFSVRCVAYAGERNTFDNITTMQQMTPEVCSKAKIGDTATLLDTRDRKAYTIQKLSDGNCWMTSNMKLDLSTTDLSTSDSDVSANFDAKSEYKADSSWGNSTAADQTRVQFSANGRGSSNYNPAYGYYYSWCAATAGTCSSATTQNTDAPSSICPKGWKLPKGRSNSWEENDFLQLMRTTNYNNWNGSTKVTTSAFPTANFTDKYVAASELAISGTPNSLYLGDVNWVRAGNASSSGLNLPGSYARYWSRTAATNTSAYDLTFADSYLYPAYNNNRYFGYSIRCIAYSS